MKWFIVPSIKFSQPGNLFFFIPVLVLLLAGFVLRRHLSKNFNAFFAGGILFQSRLSSRRSWAKGLLFSLAFCTTVLASAGPFAEGRSLSYNFMALVDISQSMWCEDCKNDLGGPISRLEMAKRNLVSLLEELPADGRLGLGVFAGGINPLLILTPPRKVGGSLEDLKAIIRSIQCSWTWHDGTSLEGALLRMGNILEKRNGDYGPGLVLILLTDGEETTTSPSCCISPATLLELRGVHLYFAGHGTTEGAPVPEFNDNLSYKHYRLDAAGNRIISRLDEGHLKKLAESAKGTYKRIRKVSDLQTLARSTAFKLGENRTKHDLSWLLWLGCLLMIGLFLIL